VYSNGERFAAAEIFLRRSLAVAPDNMSAMVNLAELYYKMGDNEQAARYERRVEAYRLRNPYYRYLLAEEAFGQGRYAEAARHLQRAAELKSEYTFYLLLARTYDKQGKRELARRTYEKALILAPPGERKAALAPADFCCGDDRVAVH
jgi:Flp pilus assembly protein TadD